MKKTFGFITGNKPLEEEMKYAVEHKFDHIEIDLIKDDTNLETFDRKRIHELKRLSFDSHVSISLHLPYTLNLLRKNIISRNKIISQINHTFDLAADLNATHITCHIGSFSKQIIWSDPREEFLKRAINSIASIADIADSHHIGFALENLIPLPSHSAYHFIGDNINDFSAIFSKVNSEFIGLCLDLGHSNLSEGGIQYIKRHSDKIFCVHYHDNSGRKDEHLQIGEGNILWKEIILELDKREFSGPYVSECFNSEPHLTRDKLLEII
ncbi:MAG: sugar phosphate isomerase/epimerase [Candidatus Aminicenantes bacterium]|nr:sugar phosphate isomerase/epimerase [Candidatus Aminicenantes bacterium]